ncbi:DUF3987 domain-containing protein [Paraglaciecola aquimarina]|uniref:DUF3987 domain-containing protein n=1 Tax=Paraglaciecola algarum TaxID=3050085 RepID=A0ABS9D802_9ALTE|nr:YfjI family protein [Paraglaciecola sp. G1-23]MCF2948495.1 DUF3987 domain-containing protein [Paraglaciecola sp. G1-23]
MKPYKFSKLPLAKIIKDFTARLGVPDLEEDHSNSKTKTLVDSTSLSSKERQPHLVTPTNFLDVDCQSFEHLNIIWGAYKEIALNTHAPGRMIVDAGNVSLAGVVQGLYVVRSPLGSLHQLSLNVNIAALSGERKTTVDRYFSKVYTILMEVINEHIQTLNNEVDESLEKWELDNKILKRAYKIAKENDSVIEEEKALSEHQKLKPEKLDFLTMVYDDFTISALLQNLYANMPVALISTSEGAKVLDDSSMKSIPLLNKCWDGDALQVSRLSRESFWVKEPKVSILTMIQPDLLTNILSKRYDELRNSGFLSRGMFCYPKSNIGRRPIVTTKKYTDKTNLLYSRLGRLSIQLLSSLSDSNFKRKELQLDQEGEQLWINFANYVESNTNPGGLYESATDLASKLAENALRVAGVLHAVEFGEGDISAKTLNTAIQICIQSSKDFVEFFVPPPQDVVYGQKLQKYLHNNFGVYLVGRNFDEMHFDERFMRQNKVLQCGPFTNAEGLNQALGYLSRQGIVAVVEEIKVKGKNAFYIDLVPQSPLPLYSSNGYPLRYACIN